MKNSKFINAHGLEEDGVGNISTAYDMALLTSYAMKNENYRKITGTKRYTLKTNMNNYIWNNKHKLLNLYEYTTGGKTGFTQKAGRTLVTTANKENKNIVVVSFNLPDDFNTHMYLLDKSFKNLISKTIISKDTIILDNSNYKLYPKKDYKILLYSKEETSYKYYIDNNNPEKSYIEIYLNNKLLIKENLGYEKKEWSENKYLFKKLLWGLNLW